MVGPRLQGPPEMLAPVGHGLPGEPVDQVQIDRSDAGITRQAHGSDGPGGVMCAGKSAQGLVVQALHAEAEPADAQGAQASR